MPRNIEIKVRVPDLQAVRPTAQQLASQSLGADEQVDRYYEVAGAQRVKLRTSRRSAPALIRYARPETANVRASDYDISPVRDGDAGLCVVPKGAPIVTVRKRREVFLVDNVRIHLDEVDGLGTFLELEPAVDAEHDEATCRRQIGEITRALGLEPSEFLRASYADLLLEKCAGRTTS
jgi:predicted adenylyl cyclase CyaB